MASRQSCRLQKKRLFSDVDSAPVEASGPAPSKSKRTNAEKCKEYKEKLKADETKYKHYLEDAKNYSKQYRATVSEEMKARQKEQSKLRMREMRKRRKAEEGLTTRKSTEQKRAAWRVRYQKKRENQTPQKLTAINAKRRKRYAEKTAAAAAKNKTCSENVDVQPSQSAQPSEQPAELVTPQTPASRRKILQRARNALPSSPRKFVQVVIDLQEKSSPRKKALFEEKGGAPVSKDAIIGHQVRTYLTTLKNEKSKAAVTARRIILAACEKRRTIRSSSTALGVHRQTVKKYCHKNKYSVKKEFSSRIKKERKLEGQVKDFLETASSILPEKKLVSKKTGKPVMLLAKSMGDLHSEFMAATGKNISRSQFAKCRPAHVRLARKNSLRQCLCEYCENVTLKIKTVNNVAARVNNHCRIRHHYHAVDLITCKRQDGKWHQDCAYGRCGACSPAGMDEHLHPLRGYREAVKWSRWQSTATVVNGKRVNRKLLVRKEGSFTDLVKELKEEVIFLAGHLYRADWQYCQFIAMQKMSPFPINTACMVLDFAENFACTFQNEVQAAHWHHEQATVHPIVTYYRCKHCVETVTESLVFISGDKTHDFNAVQAFMKKAVDHLRTVRQISLEHIIQWTDGCAAQYKSKGPFADVSCALGDFGCTLERNFFGSRHGKGPSDGESAVVKSGAAMAVRSHMAIIRDAEELFSFCQKSHLNKQPDGKNCKHFLRTFFFVPDIVRNRGRTVKTLKGTRSLHAVKCVKPNVLLTRTLSCACVSCHSGIGCCQNQAVVEPWKRQTLVPDQVHDANAPAHPAVICAQPLPDLANHQLPPEAEQIQDPNLPADRDPPPEAEQVHVPNRPADHEPPPDAEQIHGPMLPDNHDPDRDPPPEAEQVHVPNHPADHEPPPDAEQDHGPISPADREPPPESEQVYGPNPPADRDPPPKADQVCDPNLSVDCDPPSESQKANDPNPLANHDPHPETKQPHGPNTTVGHDMNPPASRDPPETEPARDASADCDYPSEAGKVCRPNALVIGSAAISVGDFVKTVFVGRQRKVVYFGKVKDIAENLDVNLQFLKETGGKFIWGEEGWVSANQVVAKVDPPKLAPGRGLAFIFD